MKGTTTRENLWRKQIVRFEQKKKRKGERPRIKRHQNIVRITQVAQIIYIYLWFSEQYDQSPGKKIEAR